MAIQVDKSKDVMRTTSSEKALSNITLVVAGIATYFIVTKARAKGSTEGDVSVDMPNVNPSSSYNDKVRALQRALKVGVDGIAGAETNGALENLYSKNGGQKSKEQSLSLNYPNLSENGKGVLSTSNIDWYIDALSNNKFPLYFVSRNQSVSQDANSIMSAYAKGGYLKTKKAVGFSEVVFDTSRKAYLTTGKTMRYDANVTFVSPEFLSRTLVKITDKTATGRIIISVTQAGNKFLLLASPSDLYVS